jgi:ABC-type phosphate transport system auxiliary subunit
VPTLSQQTAISAAIDAIRNAEDVLTDQIRSSTDALNAIKLTNEYNNLDSYLSELLHAQNAADDVTFANATQALQSRLSGLEADEKAIRSIIADVVIAGKVIGYIADAVKLITAL